MREPDHPAGNLSGRGHCSLKGSSTNLTYLLNPTPLEGVCYMRANQYIGVVRYRPRREVRPEFKIWLGARNLNPGPHGPEL